MTRWMLAVLSVVVTFLLGVWDALGTCIDNLREIVQEEEGRRRRRRRARRRARNENVEEGLPNGWGGPDSDDEVDH